MKTIQKITVHMGLSLCLLTHMSVAEETMLKVGTGTAKLGAILQAWTIADTTANKNQLNFKMRRAEVKLSGEIVQNARWFLMFDPARDGKILMDLGIAYQLTPSLEIVAGQFKIPTTAEGLDSSGVLLLPERSYIGRTYGLTREPGVMLNYKSGKFQARTMISNGNGTNVDDPNSNKDIHARFDYAATDTVSLGAFTTAGDYSYGGKGRWGANARWAKGAYLARMEWVRSQDFGSSANGWSVDGAYQCHKFQPVLRYDGISRIGAFMSSAITGGVNYYLDEHHMKVQFSYTGLMNMTGNSGAYVPYQDRDGSLWILALQASL